MSNDGGTRLPGVTHAGPPTLGLALDGRRLLLEGVGLVVVPLGTLAGLVGMRGVAVPQTVGGACPALASVTTAHTATRPADVAVTVDKPTLLHTETPVPSTVAPCVEVAQEGLPQTTEVPETPMDGPKAVGRRPMDVVVPLARRVGVVRPADGLALHGVTGVGGAVLTGIAKAARPGTEVRGRVP